MHMVITTIGFGDYYPSTPLGRIIVVATFFIAAGIASYIISTIINYVTSFTDTAVQNRELRKQNEEIISLLKENK